jgi:hypothetical protein
MVWMRGDRTKKLAAILAPPHQLLPIILVDWRPIASPMLQVANRYLVG